jgi:hypothetical protein
MRAEEFVTEGTELRPATFADGTLRLTQHLLNRSEKRDIALDNVMKALQRLEALRGRDLRRLPPTGFVVKTPYGFEMAMVKSQDIDTKKIEYIVTTVRERLKTGAGQRVIYLEQDLGEVNYPDELSISDQIQQYFFKRGYDLAGEGRDQMAFESPRGTIVKVLGIGEDEREQVVRRYVRFFEQNQRNPFYPRIYNSGNFTVAGETYFVYEMERVNYVANEEVTLDYIEKLMSAVDREQGEQFLQRNPVPAEMNEAEIFGLIQATEDMIQVLGGQAPLDLTAVENLGRRDNGHLVIVDPYSL